MLHSSLDRISGPPARHKRRNQETLDDAQLVESARQGCEEAFAELHVRHVGAVRLAVGDRTSDRSAVADVVQDAFVRAFERLDTLRDPSGFRPWLLQIARHAAVDHRRRLRPVISFDAGGIEPLSARDNVEDECEWRAAHRELTHLIKRFPRREAAALDAIRTTGGVDYEHLAVILGTSPPNARTIIHRARRRLRDQLTAHWELQPDSQPPEPTELP